MAGPRDGAARRPWARRALALVAGLLLAVVVAELGLRLAGLPRFYLAHSSPPQFSSLGLADDVLMYRNKESTLIRFVYDGDPRGYFGPTARVDHFTNALGFRGSEFRTKAEGALRLAFLGDSFTFGEGVRYGDTTVDVTRRLLDEALGGARDVETLNFGVGGHNSVQARYVLEAFALPLEPDVVVLGYVLNDAEAPLLKWNANQERIVRRAIAAEEVSAPTPPEGLLYRSAIARLVWKTRQGGARTEATIAAYRGLYVDDAAWWARNRAALSDLVGTCRERGIACYVLGWPVLLRLDESYPFRDLHDAVGAVVEDAGGTWVDLEPVLRGRSAASLWVHPTDHHPNEVAHALAAEALVERLVADGVATPAAPR